MRNKRDMYFNYNKSNNRKNSGKFRNRRGHRKTGFYAIIVLVIAIILGFGAFYFTNQRLKNQDETMQAQEKLRKQKEQAGEADQDAEVNKVDQTDQTNQTDQTDQTNQADQTGQVDQTDQANQANQVDETNQEDTTDGIEEEIIPEVAEPEETKEVFMPDFVDTRTPVKVKGIYVTGPRAGTESYMQDLTKLVDTTELNAMVIDIKNDSGEITYKMDLDLVQEIGADVNYIRNIEKLISDLKAKDIYLIARIVAFKDPILAENKPELSLKNADGTIFKDKDGLSWVNPYNKKVWDYLISVAEEAVKLGFDEIQFDYIRFSTDSAMKDVDFGDIAKDKTKTEAISEFTKYASEKLKPLGVYVSADVYGAIIDSKIDSEIVGQSYVEMSKYLDYICPMIYPSHYADGAFGIKHPDLEPYNLILKALNKSMSVLKKTDGDKNQAEIRSWLQDFSAVWLTNHISYGSKEIRAQIKAVYDAGYEEWILWNGNNNYTKEGLLDH